ncbi:MAG TPA: hypothetical protein VH107_16680 [Lacipirellulaceae bacterium]|jgi:hypothetical protein|nr:hypothetical protein [Lacipirellulaceae bacterium]
MTNHLRDRSGHSFTANCGAVLILLAASIGSAFANEDASPPAAKTTSDEHQAKLEAALSKMLSGATLEGSFTASGPGADPTKLSREKYTLGEVKKIGEDTWLFPTRIEYGGKDLTLPIPLPIRWAGDTPVVVVDQVELPGFGAVSARVMFFEGHYAGFWKHGEHSGNLFGEIHSAGKKTPADEKKSPDPKPPASN